MDAGIFAHILPMPVGLGAVLIMCLEGIVIVAALVAKLLAELFTFSKKTSREQWSQWKIRM
jgi:uncharacterized membrane protein YczE